MRFRAFHPAGFVSSYRKSSYLPEANHLFVRCLKQLLKNVLPTLLIMIFSSVIALFLSGLIDQAKLSHGVKVAPEMRIVVHGEVGKFP